MSDRETRLKTLAQMNANADLEGFAPDKADVALQRGFADGSVSLEDMLNAAREFASNAGRSHA